jgi:hypothetical protein
MEKMECEYIRNQRKNAWVSSYMLENTGIGVSEKLTPEERSALARWASEEFKKKRDPVSALRRAGYCVIYQAAGATFVPGPLVGRKLRGPLLLMGHNPTSHAIKIFDEDSWLVRNRSFR